MHRFILTILVTLLTIGSYAQEGEGLKDSINYAVPESEVFFEEELPDSLLEQANDRDVATSDTVVMSPKVPSDEDHIHHIGGGAELDEFSVDTSLHISEQVQRVMFDSVYWKGVDECFSLFDSMSVDPYGMDTTAFMDSVAKFLCVSKYGENGAWCFPLKKGETHVTSPFGFRRYKWHYGTDLKLEVGDTLVAPFDAVVRVAKYNPRGYGYYVILRHHNGLETLYGHMSRIDVKVGQVLKTGEMIGLGGNTGRSTGSHLHFEIRYKGKAIDPAVFYDFDHACLNTCDFVITPEHFAYYRELSKAVYHRIRSGDYLGKIAGRYHTTISKICRLNNINRNTVLRIGRRLRVR